MNKDTQSWSNSNLTEMDELLQKVQQLERENAALRIERNHYRIALEDIAWESDEWAGDRARRELDREAKP